MILSIVFAITFGPKMDQITLGIMQKQEVLMVMNPQRIPSASPDSGVRRYEVYVSIVLVFLSNTKWHRQFVTIR